MQKLEISMSAFFVCLFIFLYLFFVWLTGGENNPANNQQCLNSRHNKLFVNQITYRINQNFPAFNLM